MQNMFWNTPCPLKLPTTLIFASFLAISPLWLEASSQDWVLVWSDEFDQDGALDPQNWTYDLGAGGWGNNEIQTYTDRTENVRVENGRLIIEVQQESGTGRPSYTSARITTRGLHVWQYGRVEARARMPLTTGTWSAIWMLPEDAIFPGAYWPDNGEIDIVEHVGYEEDPLFHAVRGSAPENIHGTLHTSARNHLTTTGISGRTLVPEVTETFNTYAINWLEDRIEFEVNGYIYHTVIKESLIPVRTPPPPEEIYKVWPFDQRFHLILNIALGGGWGGHFNSGFYPETSPYGPSGIDHGDAWPQRMEVEYIRVYAPAGTATEWRGWPLTAAAYADTGAWLGFLFVAEDPWVYSPDIGGWLYLPEDGAGAGGAWAWRPSKVLPE